MKNTVKNIATMRAAARNLFSIGQLAQARDAYIKLCKIQPNDVESWFFLGAIHGQLGELPDAERCSRKVVKINPQAYMGWDNLGIALMLQGKHPEAIACFKKALQIEPSHIPALCNLANTLRLSGQLNLAIEYYREALTKNPQQATIHNNLSIALLENGHAEDAIAHANRAISLDPNYAAAHCNLGNAYYSKSLLDEALKSYQQSIKLDPRQAEPYTSLGNVMEELCRWDEAMKCHQEALRLNPGLTKPRLCMAQLLVSQGKYEAASDEYRAILQSSPADIDATAGLATTLTKQGRKQDARKLLEETIGSGRKNINILVAYAEACSRTDSMTTAIELLETYINSNKITTDESESAHFALGTLHEASGSYDNSFHHYKLANETRVLASDLPTHLKKMQALRHHLDSAAIARLSRATNDSQLPIFIVGMPRSGTSLVEQILACHPEIHGGGELTYLWEIADSIAELARPGLKYTEALQSLTESDANKLAQHYLSRLERLSPDSSRITDKLPHNFIHLALIQSILPKARIIHCIRDPLDTCFSIYSHKFNRNHIYSRKLSELGRYYLEYQSLMSHWKDSLELPILDVHYEELVENQESITRDMLDFCGVTWDQACLDFYNSGRIVNTPSYDQVRQPMYKSSIGRHDKFKHHLGELTSALTQSNHLHTEK